MGWVDCVGWVVQLRQGIWGYRLGCGMDELMGAGTKPCELGGKIGIIPRGLDVVETELNRG